MWQYVYQDELYHFGIKGMKWGVRRKRNNEAASNQNKKQFSKKKKIAIGIGIGAAVATGAAVSAYLIKRHGAKNIKQLTPQINKAKNVVSGIMDQDTWHNATRVNVPKVEISKPKINNVASSTNSVRRAASSFKPNSSNVMNNYRNMQKQNSDLLKSLLDDTDDFVKKKKWK